MLKEARDKVLTFDTTTPLSVQFAEAQQAMEQLVTLHGVSSNKEGLMMLWLRDLEHEREFEDEVADWKKKTTNNSFTNFTLFFLKHNCEVRCRNKIWTT